MKLLPGDFTTLQLDVVAFLAFFGDGLVTLHYEYSSLCNFSLLPRLIPAPTGLIRIVRPTKLPPAVGKVIGVYSGNVRDSIQAFAHIFQQDEYMAPYTVRALQIDMEGVPQLYPRNPLAAVAYLGCGISVINLALAVHYDDGMALLATIFLSILCTVVGISNKARLILREQTTKVDNLPGDVVVEKPNGAFLVVRCSEDIARQIYFGAEDLHYYIQEPFFHRLFLLWAILLLMGAVITLTNSTTQLQLSFAGSYVLLNAGYWIAPPQPSPEYWNLSNFCVNWQYNSASKRSPDGDRHPPKKVTWFQKISRAFVGQAILATDVHVEEAISQPGSNFTEALWRACFISGSTKWAKLSNAAPRTETCDAWLAEVDKQIADHRERLNPKLAKHDRLREQHHERWILPDWNASQRWKEIHEEKQATKGQTNAQEKEQQPHRQD